MTGRASREKGARGEREVCKMLAENLGGQYNRLLKQYQQSQLSDIEQLVGGYSLEVKNCAKENLRAWWQQAVTAADKRGAMPCLAYKITRRGWRFVVPMPEAWNSGHQWARDLNYTKTLYPDGFYLLIREHLAQ
jgi:Holliday junction resolvase